MKYNDMDFNEITIATQIENLEIEIDNLKATLTDIVNESEKDKLSFVKQEKLDEAYLDITNQIQEKEKSLEKANEWLCEIENDGR